MFEPLAAELNHFEVAGLARAELCDVTAGIGHVRGALDALEARVVAAVDDLGDEGTDAEDLIRSQGRCSKREARRRTRRAKKLRNMPNTARKLADGEITGEHADELAMAAEATSEAEVDNDQTLLSNAGRRPADMAGKDIRDWVNRRQTNDDRDNRHRRQRAQRSLSIFDGDDEMTVALCRTDSYTGEQLRALVEDQARRLWRDDGGRDGPAPGITARTWPQLRHDALMILLGIDGAIVDPADTPASRASDRADGGDSDTSDNDTNDDGTNDTAGTTADSRGEPARGMRSARSARSARNQVMVVVDARVISGTNPDGRIEIPGVGPLPRSVLDRLMCDAEVFGTIFGTHGQALWLGRGVRTVTRAQWQALVARDGGCLACGAHPAYCEAHHIVPWSQGGTTDIDKLVLLCGHDHQRLHDEDLQLAQDANGKWSLQPRAGPTTGHAAA